MGQRSLADPDGLGQFSLVGRAADLEVEQDKPDRQRAARLGERLVERALDGARRLAQAQPDRDGKRFGHAREPIITHRHLRV